VRKLKRGEYITGFFPRKRLLAVKVKVKVLAEPWVFSSQILICSSAPQVLSLQTRIDEFFRFE